MPLWVSGITSRATEFYFTDFLSVAVHFNIQNIRYYNIYSDLPMCNKYREVRDFSREVILLTHSALLRPARLFFAIFLAILVHRAYGPKKSVNFCLVFSVS